MDTLVKILTVNCQNTNNLWPQMFISKIPSPIGNTVPLSSRSRVSHRA